MVRKWESGKCPENELIDIIDINLYKYFVAYQTDCFLAGMARDARERVEFDKLLEIRLFSNDQEFLASRTRIGGDSHFQWRIASEEELSAQKDYTIRYQSLDIDSDYTEKGENGNLKLMTTGGGNFELPIEEGMDSIRVISYISYNEQDGMAYIYDNRLAGFTRSGGAE